MPTWLVFVFVVVVLALVLLASAVKVVPEYERGVVFRLGRLMGAKGPGLFWIVPLLDRMVKVDLRPAKLDVPLVDASTQDHATVKLDAVVHYRVRDPSAAVVRVEDYRRAMLLIAQTT